MLSGSSFRKILAATGNQDKFRELLSVAGEFGIELISPAQISAELGSGPPEVEEVGLSYYENALLKARAYWQWAKLPALADDSGLEVLALGNRPGIHSARYGGLSSPHSEKMSLLLQELDSALEQNRELDRRAYFRCSLVLFSREQVIVSAEDTLPGTILSEPRGTGGFGYDPIVLIDSLGKTLAEVDFSITCKVGFRAQAARKLFQTLAFSP